MTEITSILKIKYPIIQAPMAGSDNPQFVAAASNAGVLGSLGAQYRTPEEIEKAITEIRSLTDKPFAVNLFAPVLRETPGDQEIELVRSALEQYYAKFDAKIPTVEEARTLINQDKQYQCVLDMNVPVLSFTLGLLSDKWINAFRAKSTVLIGTATNVREALALEASGVDMICAQGSEAGGHRGTFMGSAENSMIGGFALIPQIVDAVKIPVIAAGGIMDGRGIAAAFALGASAVQMGTAFLTTSECPVNANYKQAIKNHNAEETEITSAFSGGPARGITNTFINENRTTPLLSFPFQNLLTKPIRAKANSVGDIEYTNLWSGQNGKLAREVPIQVLVDDWINETEIAIKQAQIVYSRKTP